MIDNILIATSEGPTKKEAKRSCAEKAVEILRKTQPVIDVPLSHKKAKVVEKDELYQGQEKKLPRLPERKIGSKILRKMGWTGGGGGGEVI